MDLETLTAISPVDGRYRAKTKPLAPFVSEQGLIRYRTRVEVEYFIFLVEEGIVSGEGFPSGWEETLRNIYRNFSTEGARRVKSIEAVTNHDVKAIEYFLKEEFEKLGPALDRQKEFLHFGLTSQDINNTATPMMLRDALQEVVIPVFEKLAGELNRLRADWKDIPMLARTHGQPASPTTLSKEYGVFQARLEKQLESLAALPFPGKFGGATGNFNAHYIAYPDTDWHVFAARFLAGPLGLVRSFPTTQIEHYDGLAAIFDNLRRANTILIDLCVDTWIYVSLEYFSQKTVEDEVGSSAMPHKVNPIDFENAEGNFGLANALFEFLSRTLPVSRLQRDLTDSTVLRNIGVALAHTFLALKSVLKGLDKLQVNKQKIAEDLDNNWAVVAEAIQTILRREGYPNPYEKLKELTRGKGRIDRKLISDFIRSLDVSEAVRAELNAISPSNYTGREG